MPGLRFGLAALAMAVVTACGGAAGTGLPGATDADPSPIVLGTDPTPDPVASDAPSDEPTEPGEDPSEDPTAVPEPTTSAAAVPAADCTGTEENRAFYGSVAAAVEWIVYCPVLPSGWYVEAGQYRLAGGGRLEITYRGPHSARFTLQEGAWCEDPAGCVGPGVALGSATFGDRDGALVAVDGGTFAVTADAGSTISWSLVAEGLDEATVRAFAAALIAAGD